VYRRRDEKRGALNGQRIVHLSVEKGTGFVSYGKVFSYIIESYWRSGE
jgi:hypothetical protein